VIIVVVLLLSSAIVIVAVVLLFWLSFSLLSGWLLGYSVLCLRGDRRSAVRMGSDDDNVIIKIVIVVDCKDVIIYNSYCDCWWFVVVIILGAEGGGLDKRSSIDLEYVCMDEEKSCSWSFFWSRRLPRQF
jgi:hypothetical protein